MPFSYCEIQLRLNASRQDSIILYVAYNHKLIFKTQRKTFQSFFFVSLRENYFKIFFYKE